MCICMYVYTVHTHTDTLPQNDKEGKILRNLFSFWTRKIKIKKRVADEKDDVGCCLYVDVAAYTSFS